MVKPTVVAISVTLVLQAVPGSDRAQSADARGDPVRLERSEEAMGSSFSLVLYGAERARLEAAADLRVPGGAPAGRDAVQLPG